MKTAILALLALMLTAFPATAQDWAKAKLEKSPRHREYVKVKHGDREVECLVVYPEVKEKATTVLMIHEIFGLSDWAKLAADEIAEAGYIAIAPDLLSGMGPGGGGSGDLKGGMEEAIKLVSKLPADQVTADLDAAADYGIKLPASNGKLVVGGFCWGGGQSFRYATHRPDLKAACVFYGTPPTDEKEMAKIACPVYGFYASSDARIGATTPDAIKMMKAAGKTFEPVTYEGAGHGFMRAGEEPEAKPANKKAREESWERWKEILKKTN